MTFATIFRETEDARRHLGSLSEEFLRHSRRSVGGTIVNYDQFRGRAISLEILQEGEQVFGQAPSFVKGRNDDS